MMTSKEFALRIGAALKRERGEAGLSAKDVAERIGYCETQVRKWERGGACPTAYAWMLYQCVLTEALGESRRESQAFMLASIAADVQRGLPHAS